MKKALLLVLVLAFMLVPVFSSAVSADSADAWNIGDGYLVEGDLVPAELEATENGLVFSQEKGYFGPDFDAMGWGTNFADAQGAGLGVVAKEGLVIEDTEEISVTLSLDEYSPLYTDATGAVSEGDGWFKFTLMNGPHSLNFAQEAADEELQGIAISVKQSYMYWGAEVPRLMVWVEKLTATETWEDRDGDGEGEAYFSTAFGSYEVSNKGSWDGVLLGEDVTIKVTRKPNENGFDDQNVWNISAIVNGEEQVLVAGVNLDALWTVDRGWGRVNKPDAQLYLGFVSAHDGSRAELRTTAKTFEEDTANPMWVDYNEQNLADFAGKEVLDGDGNKIYNYGNGEDADPTHIMVYIDKAAGDTMVDEWWKTVWSDELMFDVPSTRVQATIKWLNGEWLGTGDAPVDEPVDEPTDEPVDEPTDEPVDEPTDEPVDEPTDEPADEPADDQPADDQPAGPTEAPSVVPPAGQDFSVAIILGSMAGMLAIAGAAVMVNKSRA